MSSFIKQDMPLAHLFPLTIIIIIILIVICKANFYLLVVKETGGIFKSTFSYIECVYVSVRERVTDE